MKLLLLCAPLIFFLGSIVAKNIYFDEELDSRNEPYLANLNDLNYFLEDKDIKINERRIRHVEMATESMFHQFQKEFRRVFPKRTRKYNHKDKKTKKQPNKHIQTTKAPPKHRHKKPTTRKSKIEKKKKETPSKGRKRGHKRTTKKHAASDEINE